MYSAICETDSSRELAVPHRELNTVLCDSLEGGGGWRGQGELQKGDIYILMAASCCCMEETNTIL